MIEGLSVAELARLVGAAPPDLDARVTRFTTDSRTCRAGDVFVALRGARTDGHLHVDDALRNGAVAALVEGASGPRRLGVPSPLAALQAVAAWHRGRFRGRVVAVTGSNGKTVVKDALTALLGARHRVAATPGSWNSQLGVPLAVLSAPVDAELYVFEAGISAPGEMERHRAVLRPDVGVLTNVGLAHIAWFRDRAHLAAEKLRLFAGVGQLYAPGEDPLLVPLLAELGVPVRAWSALPWSTVGADTAGTRVLVDGVVLRVPTTSAHLLADVMMAVTVARDLGVDAAAMEEALAGFTFPSTRMEHWRTPDGVLLINDACSADPLSVQAALRSAAAAADPHGRRSFVFAGMPELGADAAREHALIGTLAAQLGYARLVAVGPGEALDETVRAFREAGGTDAEHVATPEAARARLEELHPGDTVLVKGPRDAGLDAVARQTWESIASKRFVVDLDAVRDNLAWFRRTCPGTQLLAMLKAWAYGSGLPRIAAWMAEGHVDWIGVSAVDEGATIRRAGVQLPVLVLLADAGEVDKLLRHGLTPMVYSLAFARQLFAAAAPNALDVHVELDTGMGRLGVLPEELDAFTALLAANPHIRLTGVMTHMASADDPDADAATTAQLDLFDTLVVRLEAAGHPGLLRHAAATSAAIRFPRARYDMVRIGLGMYGIAPGPAMVDDIRELRLAVAFVARIARVATYAAGARIGYSGTYVVPRDGTRVGLVDVGYNDGVPWRSSNAGTVMVRGVRVPIVGRVSMDSLSIDLTGVPDAAVGDEVLLFGEHDGATLRPEAVAAAAGTIPYELLVKVDNRRVQRVFLGG